MLIRRVRYVTARHRADMEMLQSCGLLSIEKTKLKKKEKRFVKDKIDPRLLIEPDHPNLSSPETLNLASVNRKLELLKPEDITGDAVKAQRTCR
jgi:hypothetical protein